MRSALALGMALLLTTSAAAGPTPRGKDTARQELEDDICYERNKLTQMAYEHHQNEAALRRAGEFESNAAGQNYDTNYKILDARVSQLCARYFERYKERAGCCGDPNAEAYLKLQEVKAEREKRAAPMLEAENSRLMKLFPDDRVAPCREFHAKYGVWPEACPLSATSGE